MTRADEVPSAATTTTATMTIPRTDAEEAEAIEDAKERDTIVSVLQNLSLKKKEHPSSSPSTAAAAAAPSASSSSSAATSATTTAHAINTRQVPKPQDEYKFWNTQPVLRFDEESTSEGPIEPNLAPDDIRKEPYPLHTLFCWSDIDLSDAQQLEEVYTLLTQNYVEDEDAFFRFDYSAEFIQWALQPPQYRKEWHVGVRTKETGKLVAFISGIPVHMRVHSHEQLMAEINFLCVHKKLRSKRLTPLLIKEITRRIHLQGIFQAVYTAGVLLPKPVATCRYWHRSLNPKKLIETNFSALAKGQTMAKTIKHFQLQTETKTPHLRPMVKKDVKAVVNLLNSFMRRSTTMHPIFNASEVSHWFLPRENVIFAYVVQDPKSQQITDFVSFYNLPSTVMAHIKHREIKAAYCFYYAMHDLSDPVKTNARWQQLMEDTLILSKQQNFDVFNCVNLLRNHEDILKELKFGIGDGQLRYYFYNWKCPPMNPDEVGLVML